MSIIEEEKDVVFVRIEWQAIWGQSLGLCKYAEVGEIMSFSITVFFIKFQNTVSVVCEVNDVLQQLRDRQTKA